MSKPLNYPTKPKYLWDIFYDMTQIPHGSKNETKIREYFIEKAKSKNLVYKVDSTGNLVIYVPATKGKEKSPTIIIQNHMDMVTDATVDKTIDFKTDSLTLKVEDNFVKADRTTLGADNGIGCAASLATIFESNLEHPPLELLFTVDEETGLNGANGLDSSMLSGRIMINLDTEEDESIYVGCAGGMNYEFTKKYKISNEILSNRFHIKIGDLSGGHSGLDINRQLGNANKILSDFLFSIRENKIQISSLKAGKAHNIISRDAECSFSSNLSLDELKKVAQDLKRKYLTYLPKEDHNFTISIENTNFDSALSEIDSNELINFMNIFPHGASLYNLGIKELVSLSNNFAIVEFHNGNFRTLTSIRFLDRNEAYELENKMHSLGNIFKMEIKKLSEYPSWRPDFDSNLLKLTKEEYKLINGEYPNVKAIHAGLECGILIAKFGKADAISIGPIIKGAHSPTERVSIASVEKFWKLYVSILKKL